MDFLILVCTEGVETTGSVFCGTEQVTVSVDLRMVWLALAQHQPDGLHTVETPRRSTYSGALSANIIAVASSCPSNCQDR